MEDGHFRLLMLEIGMWTSQVPFTYQHEICTIYVLLLLCYLIAVGTLIWILWPPFTRERKQEAGLWICWRKQSLGAFVKLRKATVSFVISVCISTRLFVCMEQLGSHWTYFYEIWNLSFPGKSEEKFQVSLKSDKNNEYSTWRRFHIYDNISLNYY
jgi:hypothetical protein